MDIRKQRGKSGLNLAFAYILVMSIFPFPNSAWAGTPLDYLIFKNGFEFEKCPLTGENECKIGGALSNLYEETYIQKVRECTDDVYNPNDFIEDCGFGSVCFHEVGFNGGAPLCHRSIDASQSDKPYYDYGCGTAPLWQRNPTGLQVDCRCRTTGDSEGGASGTLGDGNGYVDPTQDPPSYPGGPVINCATQDKMTTKTWPVAFGLGPRFNAWYQQNSSEARWFSADVDPDTREMFAIIRWSNADYVNSATIVAWNLDTGDRRIVTGLYPKPDSSQEAFGFGYLSPKPGNSGTVTEQPLSGANVLRIGPDNMLYTLGGGLDGPSSTREIVRIDPTTGERTLAWKSQDDPDVDITGTWAGQCFRPDAYGEEESIAFQWQAFEVGPDGTFYLSMHGIREGDGIVSISADGQTCSYHSRWGGSGHNPGGGGTPVPAPTPIGGGIDISPGFPVQGLLFHDGLIHGVVKTDLFSFNLANGNRQKDTWNNGVYAGIGYSNMFWDPTRNVIWAVGTVAQEEGSIVDLATGRRESIYADSEWGDQSVLQSDYATMQSISNTMLANANSIGRGGVILDPGNNNIIFAVLQSGGLVKMELSTFNNFVFSW
jgi:hypothetical protein